MTQHYRGNETIGHPSTETCSLCRAEARNPKIRIDALIEVLTLWTRERAKDDAAAARSAAAQAVIVREALSAGVSAQQLMQITGLSKSRIYQIKDGTSGH